MSNAIEQFRNAIRSAGLEPPTEIVADGRLHRFTANGKSDDDAGWYILYGNGIPAGTFGDWRTGNSVTWRAADRAYTAEEDAEHRERVDAMRRERDAEEQGRHAEARDRAVAIWSAAQPALDDHPYLLAKRVKASGMRIHKGQLVVPMYDANEVVHSLQFIGADGRKRFLSGGRVLGCHFLIGKPDGVLCIAEGYATAASIHAATGYAVAVAFNARNLTPVALALRTKLPQAKLIVCGDDDSQTSGNPGITNATKAARAVDGLLAIPAFTMDEVATFGEQHGKQPSDFNDMAALRGMDAVQRAIAAAKLQDAGSDSKGNDSASCNHSHFGGPPNGQGSSAAGGSRATPIPPSGVFVLPNDHYPFPDSARHIFATIAKTQTLFVRGSTVVELVQTAHGKELAIVTSTAFRSRLDNYGHQVCAYAVLRQNRALQQKRCSEDVAKALLATKEAQELLPRIDLVAAAPIIVECKGMPRVLGPGYDEDSRVLVIGGEMPHEVPLDEAVAALRGLLADYDFQNLGDESRALAALITTALKMGFLLDGPTPVDVGEADQSQAGKTFRHKLVRAIYAEHAYPVALREGGVGSLDESISQALLSGKPFVVVDNVRGIINSQFLESVITTPKCVSIRVPHRGEVTLDASRVTFQMSSNGVETTRDFANRSSIVRIRKRAKGHQFREYAEGDLLRHVEVRQAYYLGCVFAIVREWILRGKPHTSESRHDFREWAQSLDWIMRNLFGSTALLDGHEQAQERVSNPALSWLRQACMAVDQAGQCGQELSATDLFTLCVEEGIEFQRRPGCAMREEDGPKLVGQLLAKAFRPTDGPVLVLDAYQVTRREGTEYDEKQRKNRDIKRYVIEHTAPCAP